MTDASFSKLLQQIATIARDAGDAILVVYGQDFEVECKQDHSPVTAADLAAQRVITAGLEKLDDVLPIISEEARAAPWSQRSQWTRYWLVDPLDGTREFIKRNGEFTVNIALIDNHEPVLGVVLAPVTGEIYVAARGEGAWMQSRVGGEWKRIGTRHLPAHAIVAGSRSHGASGTALLQQLIGDDYASMALGSSLKFCVVARGDADVYLRRGATSEWDTAAAQAVLEEAGGAVLNLAGDPLRYNRGDSLINPEFIAVGDVAVDWKARLQAADLQTS